MLSQDWGTILTELECDFATLVDAAQTDKGLAQSWDVQSVEADCDRLHALVEM